MLHSLLILEVAVELVDWHTLFDVRPQNKIRSPLLDEETPIFFNVLLCWEQQLKVSFAMLLLLEFCQNIHICLCCVDESGLICLQNAIVNASSSPEGIFQVLRLPNVFQERSWRVNFRVHLPPSVGATSFLLACLVALHSASVNLAVLFLHLQSGCNMSTWPLWGLLLKAEVITFLGRIRGRLHQGGYFRVGERPLWQLGCYLVWAIHIRAQRLVVWHKRTVSTCFIEGSLVFATRILSHLTRFGKVWSLIRTHLIRHRKLVIWVSPVWCWLPFVTEDSLSVWDIQGFRFIWLES